MLRKITHLIVHCTDSPDSADQIDVTDIRKWHKDKGWHDIGYHFVVTKQGEIQKGRPEYINGAHARGYNRESIGICWVGRNDCNNDQWWALAEECAEIVEKYNIPLANILGHCELPEVIKTCPNINMTKLRNIVQQITGRFK